MSFKVYVSNSVGCESTEAEGNRVIQYLSVNGHRVLDAPDGADYIIFNTCAFVPIHRNSIVEKFDAFSNNFPHAKVIVMGCVREIAPELLAPYTTALVCGHEDIDQLDSIFCCFVPFKQTPPYSWSKNFNRVVIPVGRGCAHHCSYCSIKKSVGFIKSRPIDDILSDIRSNLAEGNKRFLLAGDDLGSYGADNKTGLTALFQGINSVKDEFTVLLSNIHPSGFLKHYEGISDFMESRHASKWLFLPIQSASRQVLESMRRRYEIPDVSQKIEQLMRRVPDLMWYYDIIVGYPTESTESFEETLRFIVQYPPTCIMVAKFSHEKGTEAEKMPSLAEEIVKERIKHLHTVYRTICAYRNIPNKQWGEE